MTQQETSAIENTDATDASTESQVQEKFYSQREFDDHMAKLKNSLKSRFEKQYADLGDPEELRQLKAEAEKRRVDEQKKRGEFDKVMQELASKKDEEIRKRDAVIRNYQIDVPLVNSAAQLRAVNAEQVKTLLKPYVRLSESGEVEVLDEKGTVRYNDAGQPFGVEDLVREFLQTNPHFVAAGPTTTLGKSSVNATQEDFDPMNLDLSDPRQRALYRDWRKSYYGGPRQIKPNTN